MQWFHFNLSDFSISFLSILFEGVPFMFIGTLIAGVVDAFVPAKLMERMLPRNMAVGVAVSGVLGVIFPMCECGVVPVIRRMVLKGMPVSCGLTYLLAAPIVNPIVAVSTYAAFRGQNPLGVTSLRIALGYAVACIVGLVVERIPIGKILNREMMRMRAARGIGERVAEPELVLAGAGHGEHAHTEHGHEHVHTEACSHEGHGCSHGDHKHEHREEAHEHVHGEECCGHGHEHHHHHDHGHAHSHGPGFGGKVVAAFRCAGYDFLEVGMYLIIGAALTSVFNTAVNQAVVAPMASNAVWATGSMMLLAMVLSLCSTSDAFIAANFIAFPMASKLAFMVLGPMMDLKLLFMYGMVFRKRFTIGLAVALFAGIGAVCVVLGVLGR
ncbi:permease [soil metagenome]